MRRAGGRRAGLRLCGATGTGGAPVTRDWVIDCLQAGHEAVILNRELVLASTDCACIYCLAVFPASSIRLWTDGSRRFGRTALCPRCGIDSVLPDAAGFPLTPIFLQAMQARWHASAVRRAGQG